MTKQLKRLSGLMLMIFSALGILICLSALTAALIHRTRLINSAINANQTLLSSLETANDGLDSTRNTLSQSAAVIQATRGSIQELSGTISNLDPVLSTTGRIIGDDLREVIEATQSSLVTAEISAQNVDKLLFALDSISFLTGVRYDPEQTLAEGIAGISEELEPLPASFQELALEISTAEGNLTQLTTEINKIEESLGDFDRNFSNVETILEKTQKTTERFQEKAKSFQADVPKSINWLTAAAVFVLIWLAVVQLGLFFQGAEMAGFEYKDRESRLSDSPQDEDPSQPVEESTEDA